MNRKRIRLFLSLGVLLALSLACNVGTSPQARVDCTGTGQQFACTVRHTSGGTGQVCWDIRLTCANGTISTANSCVQLSPGETVSHNVPVSQFANFTACDSISTTEIVNRGSGT